MALIHSHKKNAIHFYFPSKVKLTVAMESQVNSSTQKLTNGDI